MLITNHPTTVVSGYSQIPGTGSLTGLTLRYLGELSELKAARLQGAEVQRMREQLQSAQSVSSALAAGRDEMRGAVDLLTTRLAAAEERARRLAAASSIRDVVLQVRLLSEYERLKP